MRFHFGQRPNETDADTIFAPLQEDNPEKPRIRAKVYLTDAQHKDSEPGGSGTGYEYQAGAGPKHGELSSSHETFLKFRGDCTVLSTPLRFITYPKTIPMHTS
jgi:hypothetical protein